MSLKTDYKDEILRDGEDRRYNLVDENGRVVYSNIKLDKAYTPQQEGDEFNAKDINEITKAINGMINLIYPVGAQIYNASKDFNPNEYYQGTTWRRLNGVVLGGINEMDTDESRFSFNKVSGTIIGGKYNYLRAAIGAYDGNAYSLGYKTSDKVPDVQFGYGLKNITNTLEESIQNNRINHFTRVYDDDGIEKIQNIQPTYMTYIWERTA